MAGVMIVDIAEYQYLNKIKDLIYLGIGLMIIMFMTIIFLLGMISANHKMLAKVQAMQEQTLIIQQEQTVINENAIRLTKSQSATAELLISWGSLIKDRNELITQNNKAVAKK